MSLSATHSCVSRPNKNKPPSAEVLLWWTKVKAPSEQLRFHWLHQKSLYLETLLSLPWSLSSQSLLARHCTRCNGERPTAHVLPRRHATCTGAITAGPSPPPTAEAKWFCPRLTPRGHTPLYCHWIHSPRHHWSGHMMILFWCNSLEYIPCDVILKCESVVFFKHTFLSSSFFHISPIYLAGSPAAEKI